MATKWVLIELAMQSDRSGAYPNQSIGEIAFGASPRTGDFLAVRPEQEQEVVVFEVVAVMHAPEGGASNDGDLYLRRIGQSSEMRSAIRGRLA